MKRVERASGGEDALTSKDLEQGLEEFFHGPVFDEVSEEAHGSGLGDVVGTIDAGDDAADGF